MFPKNKNLLKILLSILLIVTIICYVKNDLKTSSEIIIQGNDICQNQTSKSLQYLKDRAPKYHDMVEKYIGIISCAESGSGINVFERPPHFVAGRATREAGLEWYAGSIVHDACHIFLYEGYRKTHPFTIPPANVWSGEMAEKKCITIQKNALEEAGAPSWVFDSLKNASESKYWEDRIWW